MFNLYLTYQAPNGTNDLVVCDQNHNIVSYIPEATFGFFERGMPQAIIPCGMNMVFAFEEDNYDPQFDAALYSVELFQVLERIAISPISDGSKIVNELKQLKLIA